MDAAAQDRKRREAKYTFGRVQTQRLHFLMFSLGPASATAYCFATAPNEVKAFCSIIVSLILTGISPFDSPAEDECYEIFARLGFPPTGARIVKC